MRRILLFMLLLCTSVLANAAENELKLGVATGTRYSDNVVNVSSGKKTSSFSFNVGPTLEFDSSQANYELGTSYEPRFRTFTNLGRRNELTHDFKFHGDYRPADRWTLGMRESFGLQSEADRDLTQGTQIDLDGNGNKQTLRNSLDGNFQYGITPRFSILSNAGYEVRLRQDKDLVDFSQISGGVRENYVASSKDTWGVGVTARHQVQTGAKVSNITTSTTDFYGALLNWDHRFTPLAGLSASGGPTWVVSRRKNDGRGSRLTLNYFASAQLFADFGGGSTSLSYVRSNTDFAITATAFIVDEINLKINWRVTRKLALSVAGGWNQRTAISNFSFGNAQLTFVNRVIQWTARGEFDYQISPELRSSLSVDFLKQNEGRGNSNNRFTVSVRFNYRARSFRF